MCMVVVKMGQKGDVHQVIVVVEEEEEKNGRKTKKKGVTLWGRGHKLGGLLQFHGGLKSKGRDLMMMVGRKWVRVSKKSILRACG